MKMKTTHLIEMTPEELWRVVRKGLETDPPAPGMTTGPQPYLPSELPPTGTVEAMTDQRGMVTGIRIRWTETEPIVRTPEPIAVATIEKRTPKRRVIPTAEPKSKTQPLDSEGKCAHEYDQVGHCYWCDEYNINYDFGYG